MRDKLCYEDTVRKLQIISQNNLPVSMAVEHMKDLKNIFEMWNVDLILSMERKISF